MIIMALYTSKLLTSSSFLTITKEISNIIFNRIALVGTGLALYTCENIKNVVWGELR
jgi:hypothetical protein